MAKAKKASATRKAVAVPPVRRERRAAPAAEAEPRVLEEICVEELAIDGICGVY